MEPFAIVLEKRSNFAVKLIFQYEPLKLVTLEDFVHNPECVTLLRIIHFLCLEVYFEAHKQLYSVVLLTQN